MQKNSDEPISEPENPFAAQEKKWNNAVVEASRAVNVLLQQSSFREYLKSEVLKQFDGDYDVLIAKVVNDAKNAQVPTVAIPNGTANTTPNQDASSTSYDWPESAINTLEEMSTLYPLMQLSVQIDPTEWGVSYIPNVVYLDAAYEEDATTYVQGFDAYGNSIMMDATIEPTQPVVIVSGNERGFIDYNGVYELFDGHTGDILPTDPLIDTLKPIDPNEPLKWYRKNYKYEAIYAMRYDQINQVEMWPAGAPETRVSVFTLDPSDSTKYIEYQKGTHEPPRRKNINGKWWDCGPRQMHLWRWFQSGTTFKYAFYEYDYSPISQKEYQEIGNLAGSVLDSLKIAQVPVPIGGFVRYWYAVTGLALPKENHKSEYLGEIEMSVNNNNTEFSIGTGGFRFISKPVQ